MLSTEPETGLPFTTLRSPPELKLRVSPLTDYATQAPLRFLNESLRASVFSLRLKYDSISMGKIANLRGDWQHCAESPEACTSNLNVEPLDLVLKHHFTRHSL